MRALLNRAADAWYALAVRALRPYERRWRRTTAAYITQQNPRRSGAVTTKGTR